MKKKILLSIICLLSLGSCSILATQNSSTSSSGSTSTGEDVSSDDSTSVDDSSYEIITSENYQPPISSSFPSEEATSYKVIDNTYSSAFSFKYTTGNYSNQYGVDASTNILKFNTYKDRMETLILLERARELCFEGKRWFDLMRYNYRHVSGVQYDKTFAQQGGNYVSNYSEMLSLAMSAKYTSPAVMATKMPTEPYLYWPINTAQMDVNSKLVQNPVWQASASSARK